MKNYEALVCCINLMSLASVDNDKLRLGNSSYHVQPHSIVVKYQPDFESTCSFRSSQGPVVRKAFSLNGG